MDFNHDLVVDNVRMVYGIAGDIARALPSHITRDDLTGYGFCGLIEAAKKFDPTKAAFSTYARTIIRGRIMDGLREERPGSRLYPRDFPVSLEVLLTRSKAGCLDISMDDGVSEPHRELISKEEAKIALGMLTKTKQASVAWLYFGRGFTAREIGTRLGVSESRICQIVKDLKENEFPKIAERLNETASRKRTRILQEDV